MKNILRKEELKLPMNKKKRILKQKIEEKYSWLNNPKNMINDEFDSAVFNRLRKEE